jgi:hypothetical protein
MFFQCYGVSPGNYNQGQSTTACNAMSASIVSKWFWCNQVTFVQVTCQDFQRVVLKSATN